MLSFFSNPLTQELAHRFGMAVAGNPFGMLGRVLAHWDAFLSELVAYANNLHV